MHLRVVAARSAASAALCLHLNIIIATELLLLHMHSYTDIHTHSHKHNKTYTKSVVCRLPSYCENIILCSFLSLFSSLSLFRSLAFSVFPAHSPSFPVSGCCKLDVWQCDNKIFAQNKFIVCNCADYIIIADKRETEKVWRSIILVYSQTGYR